MFRYILLLAILIAIVATLLVQPFIQPHDDWVLVFLGFFSGYLITGIAVASKPGAGPLRAIP